MKFRDFHVHLEEGPFTIEWIKQFIEAGKKQMSLKLALQNTAIDLKSQLA